MERVKKIERHYIGNFRLLDFRSTHSQLLLRCSNFIDSKNVNVDLKFEMVEYIELPCDLNDIYICNGGDQDWEYIKSRHNGKIYNTSSRELQFLFKIISDNKPYFIIAGSLVIDTNTLPSEESSIITDR